MNKTSARTRDIPADTLSKLTIHNDEFGMNSTTGEPAASHKHIITPTTRKRQVLLAGVIAGMMAAAAFSGVTTLNSFPSTAALSHASPGVQTSPDHGTVATVRPPMMDIVPARMNDNSPGLFIGTGDGSNGSWIEGDDMKRRG